jgi:hypothetical protein
LFDDAPIRQISLPIVCLQQEISINECLGTSGKGHSSVAVAAYKTANFSVFCCHVKLLPTSVSIVRVCGKQNLQAINIRHSHVWRCDPFLSVQSELDVSASSRIFYQDIDRLAVARRARIKKLILVVPPHRVHVGHQRDDENAVGLRCPWRRSQEVVSGYAYFITRQIEGNCGPVHEILRKGGTECSQPAGWVCQKEGGSDGTQRDMAQHAICNPHLAVTMDSASAA